MNISNYQSMRYINSMVNTNLFSNTSNTNNALTNIFTGASYYNTLSKYAIANKYNNASADKETTVSATKFLSQFDSNYSDLQKSTDSLKNALKTQATDTELIAAAKDYIESYNTTTAFLNDKSSTSTTRLNILKSSLSAVSTAGSSDLANIGITKNTDGTLNLNESKFKAALSSTATPRTLNSLVSRTEVSTKMATSSSKSQLVAEQNKALAHSSTSGDDELSYENFLALSKNQTALRNFYYNISSLGVFMDFSL